MNPDHNSNLLPVTTSSEDARLSFELGRHAAFHYQPTQAQRHLDAAIAADPTFVLAYLHRGGMSLPSERKRYFDLATANRNRVTDDEGRMVDAFHAFLWDGKVEDAIAIFSELASRYQGDPYLPTYLGLRYLNNLGDLDTAKEQFQRAILRDPSFSQAHHWLGRVALARGDYEEAVDALFRYARMADDQPRPHDSLGLLYLHQGNLDAAEAHFEAALERDPGFADSRENLSRVQVERRRNLLIEAFGTQEFPVVSKLFTSGAEVAFPGGNAVVGSAAIARILGDTWAGSDVQIHPTEFHLGIGGDVATDLGRYEIISEDGEKLDVGRYVTVWALTVDGWKVHRALWRSDR